MTVDVIQRGEALAIFERDLIIRFQQISKATALYVRALLGGVKRALEIYRRVDDITKNHPWDAPTTEEIWHAHAEGVLMVALSTVNIPVEAWKSARILRAVPNCRLSVDASLPYVKSSFECRREWSDGLSPDTSRSRSFSCASHHRIPELEACRKEISSDWRETSNRHPATSGIHQDSLEAFGIEQEGELCVSATVQCIAISSCGGTLP